MKTIYLDNAATTRMPKEVLEAMLPYFTEEYGNPTAEYRFSDRARRAVEDVRAQIASGIGASPFEIYFTSGGSESDNWAIKGAAELMRGKGNHIITTKMEHHAVLNTCEYLERQGFEVTYLDIDEFGMIDLAQLENAIRPETILISIMYANNEIGSVQPVIEIGEAAHEHGILFHTDAVQAFGHIPIDVHNSGIHLLSASAHKLGGPKGIGLLYIDSSVSLPKMLHGGNQENGLRAGTINTPGIVGFGKAVEIADRDMAAEIRKENLLRSHLIQRILEEISESMHNGSIQHGLQNLISISFAKVDGSALLYSLEQKGIIVSVGSACTSASKDTSHVLKALGVPKKYINGTIRISISRETTMEELDYTINTIKDVVSQLREHAG